MIGALLAGVLLTVSMFEQNINTDIYTAWVNQDLIPKLSPQSIVVMDNATFHKREAMIESLSPDLNPIEKKWAKIKALRRKQGGTIDSLFQDHNI